VFKEIVNFVQWQWNKYEFWQKCFVASSAFFGAALVAPAPYGQYLSFVPMCVIFSFMTKWLVWDGAKAQWKKYKEEKENLFTTIKESDK